MIPGIREPWAPEGGYHPTLLSIPGASLALTNVKGVQTSRAVLERPWNPDSVVSVLQNFRKRGAFEASKKQGVEA